MANNSLGSYRLTGSNPGVVVRAGQVAVVTANLITVKGRDGVANITELPTDDFATIGNPTVNDYFVIHDVTGYATYGRRSWIAQATFEANYVRRD